MRAGSRSCWPLLLAISLATACPRKHHPMGPTDTVVHELGFAVAAPRAMGRIPIKVEHLPSGFLVRVEGARGVGPVTVKFNPGVPSPLGTWRKTRTIGDFDVHYTIQDLDGGGSGGEEYELTAWRRVGNGHALYTQMEQSEMGEPDFDLAWNVIAGTKPSP